ncbi:MAG: hypothetical protein L0338_27915, partial [Acidobacteria bacterium]|nr:hypothetical protein [Acidobacteriota bacterium]
MKRVICVVLFAAVCAFPLDAQVEVVRLKIHAALVESDLSLRPIPRLTLVLQEISEGEFPAKFIVKTGFAGKAEVEVPPGRYRLSTPEPVEFQGRRYAWEMDLMLQTAERTLELSNDNATIDAAAPTPAPTEPPNPTQTPSMPS